MSYAGVEIWTPEGDLIGFSVYQGSVCQVDPRISETIDHAWATHDRSADPLPAWDTEDTCDCDEQAILIFSDYASGEFWPGTWCPKCRQLCEGVSEYEPEYGYAIPSQEEQAKWKAYYDAGWPKKGHPFPGQGGHYGTQFAEAAS